METIIWIVQIALGLLFLMAGVMKLTQPKEKLAPMLGWVNDFSASNVKMIGGLEILAGLGLLLPMVLNILPILTPLAAGGLVLVMIGAALTHLRRKEHGLIIVNLVLLALAAFIVYGRLVAFPVI